MTKETWGQIREGLARTVGQNNYANWIEPLEFEDLSDGVATFAVKSQFMGTWVSRNFGDQILGEMTRAGAPVSRVSFTVANGPRPIARPPDPAAREEDGRARLGGDLTGHKLDPRYTFDRFVVGKPNELAHAASRRVAEGGPATFNPLFLYGGVGLGKTHLMHAIAWELLRRDPDLRIAYLTAEQFMYRFVQALRERQMMDFKELFRSVDVLMVDDVQFISGKDSTQEEFFHTFNALVDQGRQIVISADRLPTEIEGMEARIVSRLQSGLVVDLHPTNYELRLGILQQKSEHYGQEFPEIGLAPGVLEFLAHRISTNVRMLEGALMRLFAFGNLVGREITLDLTQECLADLLRASDRKITVEEIQRKVSEHYRIRIADLVGPKRVRTFARPRQVAMYLSKQLTARSLPDIGRRFGGRDHTTVMHGVRRIEELIGQDSQLSDDVETLRRALEA